MGAGSLDVTEKRVHTENMLREAQTEEIKSV